MNYGRRLLFTMQVSFLIVFLPIAVLVGRGVLDLAKNRAAEIERATAVTRAPTR